MTADTHPPRFNVLGVGISAIDMPTALDVIDRWIAERRREYVCVCTVHGVMECRRSERLRTVFNAAGMVTPDGMPLVWLGRRAGHTISRVYGPDLLLAELDASRRSGHRHYFYGGAGGVADLLASRMRDRFPGLQVAATYEPPFGSIDELCTAEVARRIDAMRPDVVWVGLSTPKQDEWMARMRPLLKAPVLIGVGAAFDFHAGRKRQAPVWIQRAGLEWFFRLMTEPRRLWRRYLVNNPWFLYELALQQLGLRDYPLA
jgi:N-acetylglucosaminyldiphosphoundecaprenol N-acetyl-beta-D-mannosaminyltransferase